MIPLQDQGSFEVWTSKKQLKRQLLLIERAGRGSHQSYKKRITQKTAERFIRIRMKDGHYSILEHGKISLVFKLLSRGFTHEQVRARIASYTQESTRFVDYAKGNLDLSEFQIRIVYPPNKDLTEIITLEDGTTITPLEMGQNYEKYYRGLRKAGWIPGEARQLLPIGIVAEIYCTFNYREVRNIASQRCAKDAHPEIRKQWVSLIEYLKKLIPVIFEDFQELALDRKGCPYYSKLPKSEL